MSRVRNLVDYQSQTADLDGDATRDLNISGTVTAGAVASANVPDVNLTIAPEVLEIQVDAPDAGQDIMWKWTWEQSTLPYARRTITNSAELNVPLYKEGTYVVNNFAAYDIHGSMTQTHSLYLKWIKSAGTDNLISWATSTGPISDTHPDINGGNATDVQRITVNVPATITPPSLTNPSVAYTVTNTASGSYTFSGAAKGDNPNLGPFYRGGTYTINISATGHPFYFTTDNGTNFAAGTYFGEYTSGVTGSRTDSGTITFTVPAGAPDTLYYQCGNHSAMRGEITIKDLAVETNINGNYVVYFQHTQEGHATPVELRPIPSLVNQMCLVYDNTSGKFVPQDLATYVENTPSFENKIREVAGTAELVVEDGSAVIAKVTVYDDSTYLPLTGNNAGDQAFATDTDILYIWDGSAWQQAGASNSDDLTEGSTNLFYTSARANADFDTRIATKSTTDLTEGSNLYYTDARADARAALLVDSAPGTLDTLNELAAALGDDPNFATTVTNSIATKLPLAGGTMTGTLAMGANAITSTGTITAASIIAGDVSSPTGDVLLQGKYGQGATVNIGSERSSGGVFLGYGVQPSTTAQHEFLSSTGVALTQSAYVAADTHRWWTASSGSAVIAGSQVTTMAQRMTILANGNVGIGTDSPDYRLEVKGTATTNTDIVGFSNSNGTPKHIFGLENVGAGRYSIRDASNNTAVFFSAHDADDSYIDAGNVGIGTTSPGQKLHVYNTSGNTYAKLESNGNNTRSALLPYAKKSDGSVINGFIGVVGDANKMEIATTTNDPIHFYTNNNPTNSGIFLKADGNVGIGTTSPSAVFHVNRSTYSSSERTMKINNGGNNGGAQYDTLLINQPDVPSVRLVETATNQELTLSVGNENSNSAVIGSTGQLVFSVGRSASTLAYSAGGRAMTIDSLGNVGIGTDNPAEKLHVSGTIQAGSAGNSSANLPALRVFASGGNPEQAAIAIQQGTSEGDTIIFGDFEPYVEYGINTDNGADTIDFTAGASTGSIGVSKTLYNNSGTARTAHVKVRVNLNSGILEVGGGVKGAFVEYNTTLGITLAGGNNNYTWAGLPANVWMAMSVHVSSTASDQDDHYDIKIGPNADYGSTWGDTYPSTNVPYGFGIVTHPGDSQGFAGGHYGMWAEVIAKTNSSGQLIFSIVGSDGGSGVTVRTKGYFLA